MEQQTPTMKDRQAALLSDDPGRFEPATAFRVAQLVSADDGIVIGAHGGTQPTPLAISGFNHKRGQAELKSAFAPIVGPLGSLPPAYGELLQREERNRSGALASFFNLFAARFSELFVSATENTASQGDCAGRSSSGRMVSVKPCSRSPVFALPVWSRRQA